MRPFAAFAIAAALLAAPIGAKADKLDLSTVKCQEFLASGKDNIAIIIFLARTILQRRERPADFRTSTNSRPIPKNWRNIARRTRATGSLPLPTRRSRSNRPQGTI